MTTKPTVMDFMPLVTSVERRAIGGRGIMDLKIQNQGLLLKQLYKFYNKLDVLWVNLVWSSYYQADVPHASEPCGPFWWRDLMQLSDIFRGVTEIKIGDGNTSLFWKDPWSGQPLDTSYSRAFSFAREEDVSIQKLLRLVPLERLSTYHSLPRQERKLKRFRP